MNRTAYTANRRPTFWRGAYGLANTKKKLWPPPIPSAWLVT